MAKTKTKQKIADELPIEEHDFYEYSEFNYLRYGMSVLEDRAIPDFRDGLNPVNRRILWSAYELGVRSTSKYVKAARIVGDTMGRFHPHGDAPIYGAMVKMTNNPGRVNNTAVALIDGAGNWGSLSSKGAAAPRYTEARLSKFSDEVLFNKFYMPVIETVPNFDSSSREPLILPSLLPVLFLTGKFGIAPGATTNIPKFNSKTLLEVLSLAYKGAELNGKLLHKHLRAVTTFGGIESKAGLKSEERKLLFTKKKGATELRSVYTFDEDKRILEVTGFAVDKLEPIVEKLVLAKKKLGIAHVRDSSTAMSKYGILEISFKRQEAGPLKTHVRRVLKMLTVKANFVLNFTERSINEIGQDQARVRSMSLAKTLTEWVEWRKQLEVKACAYWINEDTKAIRRLELLMIAVDNRKIIIQSLDRDGTQDDLNKWLAKKIGITPAEAGFIYDLKVRQLRALEKKSLIAQKREVVEHREGLKQRAAKPFKFMHSQLKDLEKVCPV